MPPRTAKRGGGGYGSSDDGGVELGVPLEDADGEYVHHEDATPLYTTSAGDSDLDRFVVQGYQDLWAAVLFYLHLAAVIGVVVYMLSGKQRDDSQTLSYAGSKRFGGGDFQMSDFMIYAAIAVAAALTAGAMSLIMMKQYPAEYIRVSLALTVMLVIAYGVILLATGSFLMGALCLLVAFVLACIYFFLFRHLIPLAAELLRTCATVVLQYPGQIVTAMFAVVCMVVYTIAWLTVSNSSANTFYLATQNRREVGTGTMVGLWFLMMLLMLIFFWTTELLTYVVHTTSAGTLATWYYTGGGEHMPPNPTVASFKRAMTTSFGSLCFGALLIAIISTLRWAVRTARKMAQGEDQPIFLVLCLYCVECCFQCLEDALRGFNEYALTHVAIYGTDYITSGQRTCELLENSMYSAIVTMDLIQPVVFITTLGVGALVGIVLGLVSGSSVIGLFCAIVAIVVVGMMLRCVRACCVTLYVCLAETPSALARANPMLQERLLAAATLI